MATVRELGYRPSEQMAARPRAGGGRIAVVAPFSSYESYGRRLFGMLQALQPLGFETLVHDHPSSAASPSPLLDALPFRSDVAGVVLMGIPLSPTGAEDLRASGMPVVVVDAPAAGFASVGVDDAEGGRALGAHLRAQGVDAVDFVHERQVSTAFVSSGMRRIEGLRAAGLSVRQVEVPVDVADATESLVEEWESQRPRAVCANHDLLAVAALGAARRLGVRVPEDIYLTGFDDLPMAAAAGLTTYAQPFEKSGRLAAQLLVEQLRSPGVPPSDVMLRGRIVIRDTA